MSILNTFSKIYDRVIKSQLPHGMENIFSPQISVCQKNYHSQHVLISLIEEWREYLDKKFVISTVFTDLSNAFDCVPHSLLIAKLKFYRLGGKALSYIYSYLTNRNQCCHINNKKSNFQKIIPGFPQGFIIRPILLNFSINDLIFFASSVSMYNFVDQNSLSAAANTVTELKNTLQAYSEVIINWLKNNEIIANTRKRTLAIQLEDKLNFSLHVNNICKSATYHLCALIRLNNFLCFKGKRVLIDSCFMTNSKYCLLMFVSNPTSPRKIENYKKEHWSFSTIATSYHIKNY